MNNKNLENYAKAYMQTNEGGFKDTMYLDTKGIPTIGYGTNLKEPSAKNYITNNLNYNYNDVLSGKQSITKEDANGLFQKSYDTALKDAKSFVSNFDDLEAARKMVLVDMSYTLGINGLSEFKELKKGVKAENWEKASKEILDSKYKEDVKDRAYRNAEIMKTGTFEESDKYLKEHKIDVDSKNIKDNNQTSNHSIPKEAILLADSGEIRTDVNYNYKEENMDKIEEKPEKISARLIFLENDIKNQTYGVIDGSYNISHIRGESGINNPYSYYVDFISDEKIVLSDILNIDAKIKLKDENAIGKSERFIYGKVFEAQEISIDGKKIIYRIKLVSPFHYLFCNNRYKIYQNKTIIEIITEIIGMTNHILNLQVVNQLDNMNFSKREYCTQYDQSDAEFILMLAQEEKISIVFEQTDNSPYKIILLDINSNAKRLDKPLKCSYNLSKTYSSTHFVTSYYDSEQPSVDYTHKIGSKIGHSYYKDNQISNQFRHDIEVEKVRDRLELHQGNRAADLSRYASLNTSQNFAGSELIKGVSISLFAQDSVYATLYERESIKKLDAIIINSVLEANFPNATDEYVNENNPYKYEVNFTATPAAIIYIPPMTITKPVISSVQTATVAGGGEVDVDSKGRIKVIFHFDRAKPISCYIRLTTLYSGGSFGAQFLPRVGTEVIVSFINGNIDKPIITGAVYNGNNAIPYGLPLEKTKSYIKTKTFGDEGYNELLFEDKAGEELLSLRAQKDYKLHALHDSTINIDNDQTETVGHDETISIGNNRTESVGNDETISIGNNRTESVGNDETINIGNNRTEDVGNNETINIGNNRSIKIGNNLQTSVGDNYNLKVSANSAETVAIAKALTVGAGYQITVGGAKNETVGLSSTEQVGMLKHIIAGKRYELQVGASSLILNSDGTIILTGEKIKIDGSIEVKVNSKMIDLN